MHSQSKFLIAWHLILFRNCTQRYKTVILLTIYLKSLSENILIKRENNDLIAKLCDFGLLFFLILFRLFKIVIE